LIQSKQRAWQAKVVARSMKGREQSVAGKIIVEKEKAAVLIQSKQRAWQAKVVARSMKGREQSVAGKIIVEKEKAAVLIQSKQRAWQAKVVARSMKGREQSVAGMILVEKEIVAPRQIIECRVRKEVGEMQESVMLQDEKEMGLPNGLTTDFHTNSNLTLTLTLTPTLADVLVRSASASTLGVLEYKERIESHLETVKAHACKVAGSATNLFETADSDSSLKRPAQKQANDVLSIFTERNRYSGRKHDILPQYEVSPSHVDDLRKGFLPPLIRSTSSHAASRQIGGTSGKVPIIVRQSARAALVSAPASICGEATRKRAREVKKNCTEQDTKRAESFRNCGIFDSEQQQQHRGALSKSNLSGAGAKLKAGMQIQRNIPPQFSQDKIWMKY
jgi:hypothetical protein